MPLASYQALRPSTEQALAPMRIAAARPMRMSTFFMGSVTPSGARGGGSCSRARADVGDPPEGRGVTAELGNGTRLRPEGSAGRWVGGLQPPPAAVARAVLVRVGLQTGRDRNTNATKRPVTSVTSW